MARATRRSSESQALRILFIGSPTVALQEAFPRDCSRSVDITIVTDGRTALQRLTDASESPDDHDGPDLVLLQFDFELPDGMTLLHAIKSSPRLGALPVVVLDPDATGFDTTYEAGGNAYIEPPETPKGYVALIESIATFWVEHVQYPGESLYSNG
jgi:CheY-like chemotaxis protein